jgi:HK97 family phage major capsid protein
MTRPVCISPTTEVLPTIMVGSMIQPEPASPSRKKHDHGNRSSRVPETEATWLGQQRLRRQSSDPAGVDLAALLWGGMGTAAGASPRTVPHNGPIRPSRAGRRSRQRQVQSIGARGVAVSTHPRQPKDPAMLTCHPGRLALAVRGPHLAEHIDAARSERDNAFRSAERIETAAAGRALTRAQQADYDAALAQVRTAGELHEDLRRVGDVVDRSNLYIPGDRPERDPADPTLGREQRMTDYVRSVPGLVDPGEPEHLSLAKILRGRLTGDWRDAADEKRAMAEGTTTAGGFLIPTLLSSELIDLARNQTQVITAGARTMPLASSRVDIPTWAGDPTVGWRAENASITPSDGLVGKITMTAYTLAGLTLVSRELIEDTDSPAIDAELRTVLGKRIALAWDSAALYGSGTGQPKGIKAWPSISTQSMGTNGAAPTNWDPLVTAVGALQDQNETPTAIIMAPRTQREFASLKDTLGQYIKPPTTVAPLPLLATNQVPINLTQGTSSLASDIFVADFTKLVLGVRTDVTLTILDQRYADVGQVGVLVWFRGDIALVRAKAANVVSGVL